RGQAMAPADSPYLGSIVSRVRAAERKVANYVWLIRCVGDPVFCAPNIGSGGHLGALHSPLFVGAANNHPAMPDFRAPDALQPAVEPDRLDGRRRPLGGPAAPAPHLGPAPPPPHRAHLARPAV